MGNLFFTIGTSRSGKSVFVDTWKRHMIRITPTNKEFTFYRTQRAGFQTNPRVVINEDSLRLVISGQVFDPAYEQQVWETSHNMMRALLKDGYDVMYDETNTSLQSIKNLFDIDINAKYFLINTEMQICLDRAMEKQQFSLLPVIRRHRYQLDELLENGYSYADAQGKFSVVATVEELREQMKQ